MSKRWPLHDGNSLNISLQGTYPNSSCFCSLSYKRGLILNSETHHSLNLNAIDFSDQEILDWARQPPPSLPFLSKMSKRILEFFYDKTILDCLCKGGPSGWGDDKTTPPTCSEPSHVGTTHEAKIHPATRDYFSLICVIRHVSEIRPSYSTGKVTCEEGWGHVIRG